MRCKNLVMLVECCKVHEDLNVLKQHTLKLLTNNLQATMNFNVTIASLIDLPSQNNSNIAHITKDIIHKKT